jgi:outer membrane immunogenic protein
MTTFGTRGFSRAVQLKTAAVALAAMGMAAVGSANAADIAVKAPMMKAPYNWTGCYAGGFFGFGTANNWRTNDVNGFNPGGVNPWEFSLNSTPTGGGYVGCQWQPTPGGGFVFGLEGEGGYLQLSGPGQQLTIGGGGATNVVDFSKIGTGYGLVAGRVGYVFLEKIHIYGKVGVAFYDETSTITAPGLNGGPVVATSSKSQTPLAFGGGAEFPLTDHWVGKAEYLVFEKGSSYTSVGTGAGAGFNWTENPSSVQTFKLGAHYKFW